MINQEKKKVRQWSKRLHLALLAYRELLLTICAMDKSAIDSVKHSAKVIKSNIFYVLEYRELVLTLLVTFDELKMSGAYLNDLIECQHIFLKMLQTYCGGGNSGVMVQKRGRAKKKSKKGNFREEITKLSIYHIYRLCRIPTASYLILRLHYV